MDKIFAVYTIKCPFSFEVRYVGATTNFIERKQSHLRIFKGKSANNSYGNLYKWGHGQVFLKGKIPIIEILQSFENNINSSIVYDAEKYWISYFKKNDCFLLNKTNGGQGKPKVTYNCTPVICSNGKIYESIKKATLDTGITKGTIGRILRYPNRCFFTKFI